MPKPMYTIFDSDGTSLHFPTKDLYDLYKKEERELNLRNYIRIRNIYGIWASTQDKFVEHVIDLLPSDNTHMEDLLTEAGYLGYGYLGNILIIPR